MRKTTLALLATVALALVASAGESRAQTALAGTVTSTEEGAMEGVLVTARRDGATFAVTVVSPVPAGTTQISNTASIADDGANGSDPTPGNNSGSDTTPVTAAPDFSITKSDGGASSLTVKSELSANAAAFATSANNITNRPLTGASVAWSPPAWTQGDRGAASPSASGRDTAARRSWQAWDRSATTCRKRRGPASPSTDRR